LTDTQPQAGEAAAPDPHRGERVRTAAVVLIAVAVTFAGLYIGREVFIPLGLALVFTALLRPVVRALEKVRVPTGLAATVVVLGMIAALVGVGIAVSAPVQSWSRQVPASMKKAQEKLRGLIHSIDPSAVMGGGAQGQPAHGQSTNSPPAAQQTPATHPAPAAASGSAQQPATASAQPSGTSGETSQEKGGSGGGQGLPSSTVSGVAARAFGITTSLLTGLLEVLLLTWFLLASGDMFVRKLVNVMPHVTEKKRAVSVVHETEQVVSRYLVVTLLINLGQGAAVGLAMWGLGMPSPVLWGMMTVLLEFIPYLGGLTMVLLLSLIGLASFDTAGRALLAPGAYLLITTLQNNLVSPFAYGSRLKLNPVAVMLGVMVWYALWGVPGAFLAVPIVATAKVMADRVPGLHALGEFLGE
jgi:predicted PurR-regulated permease PerM